MIGQFVSLKPLSDILWPQFHPPSVLIGIVWNEFSIAERLKLPVKLLTGKGGVAWFVSFASNIKAALFAG